MVNKVVPIFLLVAVVLIGMLWMGLKDDGLEAETATDFQSEESPPEPQSKESGSEVISTDTPGIEDITAVTIKIPPALEPALSETWLNFLRNHQEADLEEDMVVAQGEYQKALEDFAQAYTECISRKANPQWVLRAKAHFGIDVDSRVLKSLKKGIVLWGVEKAENCRESSKDYVIGKEEELMVLMKANFEMAKRFSFDLEGEEKKTFQPYLEYVKNIANLKKGPVKTMLSTAKVKAEDRHIDPPIFEFIEGEVEFQTPFDYAEALEQLDDVFGEGS